MADSSTNRRLFVALAICLLILTLAAYSRAPLCEFVNIDDPSYVTRNPHVLGGLTEHNAAWAFTATRSANWHPLTWLSHQLDQQVFGGRAWGHHLTSLLLHVANVLLLFLVLCRMTGSPWRSAFVAALFAAHPLHVESVAWVAERKDVLSTFFWMLTMLAYAGYARSPSLGRYVLVFLALALGLMAKPMLVSLPLVLLLLDFWPLGRLQVIGYRLQATGRDATVRPASGKSKITNPISQIPLRVFVIEKTPLLALALASCVVTYLAQREGGAVQSADQYPLGVRAANAAVSCMGYVLKMVWPTKLSAFYPHPERALPVWGVIVCAVLLVAITYAAIRAARKAPYVTVGWLWYLVTLVPVIGLVQVGRQASADRYTYVPLIGLFIIVAWGVPDLLARFPSGRVRNAILGTAGAAVVLALATVTWFQVGYWRDQVTLFEHALAVTSGHYSVHYLFADALEESGRHDEAVRHLRIAIKMNPRFTPAHVSLGTSLFQRGKLDQAIAEFREALKFDPNLASAHNELGMALMKRNRFDEATTHFTKVLDTDPHSAQAHFNLGVALDSQGNLDQATSHYEEAVRSDPDLPEAHYSLGTAYTRAGRLSDATDELREALRLKPKFAEAHFYLGLALAQDNQLYEAEPELREAIRLKPKWPIPHFVLARVLCRKGDYADAWNEAQRSQELGYGPAAELLKQMPNPGKRAQ